MLLNRQDIEAREKKLLAPYAVKSAESQGRQYPEEEDPFRTCFQRDRDRVIHSKAFRRLKGKTQVFVAHYGDHYRSRLVHSMEVAQLSRDIARALNLNEDLAETIALAHDLGHTPFGHAGQDAMNELMKDYDLNFEHNEQSRAVVEFLEEKKPDYPGLNLTHEVRDGLIKHQTPFDHPLLSSFHSPSLEAQVVNLADEIAYLNHDIDDGLRAEILKLEELKTLSVIKKSFERVRPKLSKEFLIPAMISSLITLMIQDLIQHTDESIQALKLSTSLEVCHQSKKIVSFSKDLSEECAQLKAFLYQHFYQSPGVAQYNLKGKEVIRFLFQKLMKDYHLLPEKIRRNPHSSESAVLVKDYIAGMTDQYALDLYEKLNK